MKWTIKISFQLPDTQLFVRLSSPSNFLLEFQVVRTWNGNRLKIGGPLYVQLIIYYIMSKRNNRFLCRSRYIRGLARHTRMGWDKKHETETRVAGISIEGHKKLFVTRSKRLGSREWAMHLDRLLDLLDYLPLPLSLFYLNIRWYLYFNFISILHFVNSRFLREWNFTRLEREYVTRGSDEYVIQQGFLAERYYVKQENTRDST